MCRLEVRNNAGPAKQGKSDDDGTMANTEREVTTATTFSRSKEQDRDVEGVSRVELLRTQIHEFVHSAGQDAVRRIGPSQVTSTKCHT